MVYKLFKHGRVQLVKIQSKDVTVLPSVFPNKNAKRLCCHLQDKVLHFITVHK